jgi:thioredoxin 1
MNNAGFEVLLQCPCSDGSSNPLLLLALCAGALLSYNWIKTLIKSKGVSFMNKAMKIVIVVALVAVVSVVFALKQKNKGSVSKPVAAASSNPATIMESNQQNPQDSQTTQKISNLPRLVDLGATKCIPCKMMAPILEELKKEYKGRLEVTFIDVWENPQAAKNSSIKIIPTQIFYDASGKELYRHEGFFSKEDILAKWKEFGINLEKEV